MPPPHLLRSSIDHTPHPRSVINLADDGTPAVLESLASETARAILATVSEEPTTASALAEHVDTSLQNIDYHLTNLREAGLVTAAGTWISSKGREMTVYALTTERIEICIDEAEPARNGPSPGQESDSSKPRAIVEND